MMTILCGSDKPKISLPSLLCKGSRVGESARQFCAMSRLWADSRLIRHPGSPNGLNFAWCSPSPG
eukprot:6211837-Pleurochrysis_carterae.AAC.1